MSAALDLHHPGYAVADREREASSQFFSPGLG